MDNIKRQNRKEDLKELILYTVFGNLTFVISIGSYALFNIAFGINELIANALAWVFAVLFSYVTNKKWVFKAPTPTKTAFFMQMFAFFSGRFMTLVIEEAIIFVFITLLAYPSMWVKLAAQVVVVVLNYVISKLFVFRDR
ncbi:GtrA family protein [Agathobacter sp.]